MPKMQEKWPSFRTPPDPLAVMRGLLLRGREEGGFLIGEKGRGLLLGGWKAGKEGGRGFKVKVISSIKTVGLQNINWGYNAAGVSPSLMIFLLPNSQVWGPGHNAR